MCYKVLYGLVDLESSCFLGVHCIHQLQKKCVVISSRHASCIDFRLNAIAKSDTSFIQATLFVNNFVMKCIENIFYLLFSAESVKKYVCICSCECPFNIYRHSKHLHRKLNS